MASKPRITAARLLAGIVCAMLLPAVSQASSPGRPAVRLSSHPAIRSVRHGVVPGEVIVRFKLHVGMHRRARITSTAGVGIRRWLGTRGLWLVHVRPGASTASAVKPGI